MATATKAIIVKENKVLIIKRSSDEPFNPNKWDLPGGRLERNEALETGLRREVFEETTLAIQIHELLGAQHFTMGDGYEIDIHTFHCTPLSTKILLSIEHSDFAWVSLQDAKKKLIHYDEELSKLS